MEPEYLINGYGAGNGPFTGKEAILIALEIPLVVRVDATRLVTPVATENRSVALVSITLVIGIEGVPMELVTAREPLLIAMLLEPLPAPATIEFANTLPPLTVSAPTVLVVPAP